MDQRDLSAKNFDYPAINHDYPAMIFDSRVSFSQLSGYEKNGGKTLRTDTMRYTNAIAIGKVPRKLISKVSIFIERLSIPNVEWRQCVLLFPCIPRTSPYNKYIFHKKFNTIIYLKYNNHTF